MIPRGNGTLLLRIVYHDFRRRIYESHGKLVDKPEGALAFMDRYIDRTEGRPGRKGQPLTPHVSKFVLTTQDGQEVEMLPSRSAEQAKAAAAATRITGDDAMILGLERATSLLRV